MSNWIQEADKEMDKNDTKGAFTKQAENSGMSVQDFASKVKSNPSDFTETTRRRAQFALNMGKIAKSKKMEKGGKVFKSPKGWSKSSQDAGEKTYKNIDGRIIIVSESHTGIPTMKVTWDVEKSDNWENWKKKEFPMNDTDELDAFILQLMNKSYAKGGETKQAYNDKLDEDLGKRLGREAGYGQSLKDRRDESKAGNETLGRRAYSSVDTMDAGNKMMKRGGSVKGKIDRDRYVKLRRDKDKAIAKLKKEKGVLRKSTLTKKKCDEKISSRLEGEENFEKLKSKGKVDNQTLLIGGIAGILFGAFLIK